MGTYYGISGSTAVLAAAGYEGVSIVISDLAY